MAKVIKENIKTYVAPAYYIKSGKIAFYEEITEHFVQCDDNSCKLTIIRKKISKKKYKKSSKNA